MEFCVCVCVCVCVCARLHFRINKDDRAAGVLENYREGKAYKDHGFRRYLKDVKPSAFSRYFSDPKCLMKILLLHHFYPLVFFFNLQFVALLCMSINIVHKKLSLLDAPLMPQKPN
jgi:hypothetical protein